MSRTIPDNVCANCENYTGNLPANVPNFRCGVGGKFFKIFYCDKFQKRHDAERDCKRCRYVARNGIKICERI